MGCSETRPNQCRRRIKIAAGGTAPGLSVSFLGDLQRSAKAGVPIYRLGGGPGFIWAATFTRDGRGVLRFLTSDISRTRSPTILNPPATSQYYVANTAPPDNFLSLRTLPSSISGQRIATMANGTLLQVLQRQADGWWYVRVVSTGQQGWALSRQGNTSWIECCQTAEAPKPIEPPAAAKSISEWNNQVVAQLERNKNYPVEALNKKEEGTVIVSFTVDRSGNLVDSAVTQSSVMAS